MTRFLALLAALLIPPAIYFPNFGAKRDRQLEQARDRLAEVEMRIEMAHAAERKLPQFRAEMQRLELELERTHRVLPPVPAIDEIRAFTESLAEENGLRLMRFEPGKPQQDNALEEQSIAAEVVGGAAGTAEFLRRIQSASKIIDVSGLTAAKDPAGWRTDFLMTTYAMQ